MSRRPSMLLLVGSIPAAMLLAALSACGTSNHEEAIAAAPAATPPPVESQTRAAAAPESSQTAVATPAATPTPAQAASAEPTPAEPAPSSPPDAAAAPGEAEAKAKPPEPPVDPVKALLDSEAHRVEYEQKLANLLAARDAAAADVVQRQKDLLAYKNPYLPRPKATPEEVEALKGKGGADRAQWAEAQIADARVKLDAAQKAYDDARANPPLN